MLCELPEFILKYGYEDEMPFDQAADDADRLVRKDTDFILKTLRTNLIRAIFEMQELFSNLLDTPVLTEDEVYSQLAGITSPNQKLIKDITLLNEFLVKRFISQRPYTKKDAIYRINYTKEFYNTYKVIPLSAKNVSFRKDELTSHIRVLENLIYVREFSGATVNPSYDVLKSDEFIEETRKSETIALQQELNNIKKPVDKIDFITGKLESFSFFNSGVSFVESDFKPSVPRKICKWLATQEAYIKENLHIDPALLDTTPLPKIKTNLTVQQLAYFFSLMEKAELFSTSNISDICRTVITSFESKKQADIDFNSFQSKFYNKEFEAIDFCHAKIKKMQEFAFADKKYFGA
ncbi:MAG: hypothetical protein A2309_06420 [Bacteroidetes bacterium RIFOXYB2_FULL_35_7]|nr:MAG: hypothetical protein A2309_06420 [Bacteroidetes bacterium RIFOXYB2_FULL_35_7]